MRLDHGAVERDLAERLHWDRIAGSGRLSKLAGFEAAKATTGDLVEAPWPPRLTAMSVLLRDDMNGVDRLAI